MPLSETSPSLREALALGLMQGPAELLPISSSGHVTIIPWLLGWNLGDLEPELRKAFEVAVHAGSAAGLILALRDEVQDALRTLTMRGAAHAVLCFLPPAVVGYAAERHIESRLGTPGTIAGGLVAGSLAMLATDERPQRRHLKDAAAADALLLGLAQACALLPGVSRGGATLCMARLRGFAREDAGVLSRHAALPVIAAAAALKSLRLAEHGLPPGGAAALSIGALSAFCSTLAFTQLVGHWEQDGALRPYALYRLALAGGVAVRLRSEHSARMSA